MWSVSKFIKSLAIAQVLATTFGGLGATPSIAQPTVVVAGPATGRHAELLRAMREGAGKAIEADADVTVTEVDDGCDAGRAEAAARLVAAARLALVIGHPCAAAAIAAARIYATAGIAFIALGVRHPDLTSKRAGPTIFRLAGRDDRQGEAAAVELIAQAPGAIAVIQDRTAYARTLTASITAALTARNQPAPIIIPIVAGRRDYEVELAKLKAAPLKVVFFAGYPPEASVVLRGMRKAGITSPLIASDANATDDFAATAAALDPSASGVKVMLRAPHSGGLAATDLTAAAQMAVAAWRTASRTAGASGDAIALLSGPDGSAALFNTNGDARIASFVAVPLVAGRWSKNANAGP